MDSTELARVFDDVIALGGLVDAAFAGQAACEIETLEAVRGRAFSDAEHQTLHAMRYRSLSSILAGVGLAHPSFMQVARDLSPEGAAKLGIRQR